MHEPEIKYVEHIFMEAPYHQRIGRKPIPKASEGIHQTKFQWGCKREPW